MKDRIIEIIGIIIVLIAILITWISLNINNLSFIELGTYSLVTENNNLVVAKKQNIKKIKKEDNIVYILYKNNNLATKTGTIKQIDTKNNKTIYKVITSNKDTNIDSSCVIGKHTFTIPILGMIINYLLTRDGFLLLIVLPLLAICVYELFKFIDQIQNRKVKK